MGVQPTDGGALSRVTQKCVAYKMKMHPIEESEKIWQRFSIRSMAEGETV